MAIESERLHSLFFDSCFLTGKGTQVVQFSTTYFTDFVNRISGHGDKKRFTVRKMSENVGVERIFPIESPFIESITVNKVGKVRRAKLSSGR